MEKERVEYFTPVYSRRWKSIGSSTLFLYSVYSRIWRRMRCVLYSCIFQEMEKDRVEYSTPVYSRISEKDKVKYPTHVYFRIWRRLKLNISLST